MGEPKRTQLLPPHQAIRSVVTTGGVYKGQGRIQRELMTHDYKAFHVHGHSSSARFPARRSLNGLPRPLGIGGEAYWLRQCSARAAQDI